MAIPSYDDLTPSIPDVKPGDVFSSMGLSSVARSAKESEAPESRAPSPEPRASSGDYRELYAALHGADAAAIERLMAIARDFSPRIESHRGGTVVLDVSGLQRLFGDPQSIAHHLAHAGAPQVAIAVSQTAAILLARAQRGVTVAAGDPASALRDVPLPLLQQLVDEHESLTDGFGLPASDHGLRTRGYGERTPRRAAARRSNTFDVLARWGLTTIGEFATLPAAALSARLGSTGIAHQRLARGIDPRPLVPDPGVRRFVESFELEWPIDTLEPLSFVFARVLEPLAAALEKADRGGVALHLRLRLTNRTTHLRTLGLPAPIRDPRVLRTLLLLDLESHPPSAAVDVVTIEIDPVPGRIVQFSLLERPVPSPETLATLMARLGALVGETRCGSPQLVDTHRPDGWAMTPVSFADRAVLPAKEPVNKSGLVASGFSASRILPPEGGSHASGGFEGRPAASRTSGQADWPAMSGRAAHASQGLAMSERAVRASEGLAMSEQAAHASEGLAMSERAVRASRMGLRRFRPPVAIRVVVEGGRPARVAIDRRGMPGGDVRQSAGPWRSSGGWWDSERWNRDEWDVAFDDGTVCRIFQDREENGWFVEGIYD